MRAETLRAQARLLAAGECSARELAERCLARIRAREPELNAFISVTEERALAEADAADAARAAGRAGPLTGLPVAHKDLFCTRGARTSCGSRMLDSFVAPYDAAVVERLRAAGMVMLGKTNMDEFAMGSSGETSWYGPARNPWDPARAPGGSSSGSAAAVAARLAPAATGSDTGGSIRQPAAFCGVTGVKPTYGRVSRHGMVAFASSLDQGGALALTAEDCALLLGAMAGFDPRDSTSAERPAPDYAAALAADLSGLRLGVPAEYFGDDLDAGLRAALEEALAAWEARGARRTAVSLPHLALAAPAYYVLAMAECSSNLARYDGVRYGHRCADPADLEDLYCRSREEGFGAEARRRILAGTYVLSAGYYDAYYRRAQRARRLIREDFVRAFEAADVLLAPVSPVPPFPLGQELDPVAVYRLDRYTLPANLAGLPALALPARPADGLPAGMQLIGRDFDEATLFAFGAAWQRDTDYHLRPPPGCA